MRKAASLDGRQLLLRATSERDFQAHVIEVALRHGWLVHHVHDSRKSIGDGFPDLVLVRPGSPVLFIELKSERGRIRPEQRMWQSWLSDSEPGRRQLVVSFIWRPSDEGEIRFWLT